MKQQEHKMKEKKEQLGTEKKILFVTVGNGKFDPLVQELDRLKKEGKINHDIIIQVGHGEYKPSHCQWFTFDQHLGKYYEKADLIIGHGGPGTVFEILRLKKPLIALPNRDRTDPQHQVEYLEAMAKETTSLLYCDHVEKINEFLKQAETHQFTSYQPPPCFIHLKVHEALQPHDQSP
ncbi:hypothetical protein HYT55_02065 [Candidatus Woesearchaeota archaeon]|nr:hypothetical protein [Candidatus Woesearchaeota archaeon]